MPSSSSPTEADSPQAWIRLGVALLLSTIGGVGMWSVVVTLPSVQAEFGAARADVSLTYTLTMIGFGLGGLAMGRLADRAGIIIPLLLGACALAAGFAIASSAVNLWQYSLAQGVLIGVGSSATFAPLIADISLWFNRRRGIAVAICASGNYLAGTVWPPLVQYLISTMGWRGAYATVALVCLVSMLPLALAFRKRPPALGAWGTAQAQAAHRSPRPLGFAPATLQSLLVIAGLACCVAMSMPQVHLVAYCSDLGYGAARGAQMLSLMLGLGVVSRLVFGWISDRIGGLRTLLLGSGLQCFALMLFLPFDGIASLYVISGLFGLFQGGIVPAYAIIVRECFSPQEAGARVSAVITATVLGMALGGWMSGAIFDLSGSYHAAFINGILWNLLNMSIAATLLWRQIEVAKPIRVG